MSGRAQWISNMLFLGRAVVGRIERGDQPGQWVGLSYLPGASVVIGRSFASESEAKDRVYGSANSRIKAMFGAGMETTATAVDEGRGLRVIARAIWRAGVWRCDRPANAHAMFSDLGRALGMNPDQAPMPVSQDEAEGAEDWGDSSADLTPGDLALVE